jgi:flagellar hook protein FlgE
MLASMFSAVSGLRAHQQMMDVIGDNIANVNTDGFKASDTIFASTLSQIVSSGNAPGTALGGTNPDQIGLGVRVAGTQVNLTQGATESTGVPTDVLIQGNGYFAVRSGDQQVYTRAGSFEVDTAGNLVDPSGAIVQGWLADSAGKISTGTATGDLALPTGLTSSPSPTTKVAVGGNLASDATIGTSVASPMTVYNSLGTPEKISISMTKTANNTWGVSVTQPDGTITAGPDLVFDPNTGSLASGAAPTFSIIGSNGAAPTTISLDFGTAGGANALTQFGSASSAAALSQDGEQAGTLQNYSIGTDGVISGTFTNGVVKALGQIAIATFTNPSGLLKGADNHMIAGTASGQAVLEAPGVGSAGTLQSGALEMSNVDLAQEFTNMIIAQRGFEANSKVISTSDQMLQDLVNLRQ